MILTCLIGGGQSVAQQAPKILIVQPKNVGKGTLPPGVQVVTLAANELDQMGQVTPVAWDLTDPTFREATTAGKIDLRDTGPTIDEAQAAARTLHAAYLLVLDTEQEGSLIRSKARLFEGARLIWQDPPTTDKDRIALAQRMLAKRTISKEDFDRIVASAGKRVSMVSVDRQLDTDNTARSLARTWAELLATGPLKSLPVRPRSQTPEPLRGQRPTATDPELPPRTTTIDDKALMKQLAAMMQSGDFSRAVNLMRDAVDDAPLSVDRRTGLVDALIKDGAPDLAAAEARRAAALMPDNPALHIAAARAFLVAGKPEQAKDEANLAIAHNAETPGIHRLLAEMDLALLKGPEAIVEFDLAVKEDPSPDLMYERAVAKAMSGDAEGSSADATAAASHGLKSDDASVRIRYFTTLRIVSASISDSGRTIASLLAQAGVDRKSPEVKSGIAKQQAISNSRLAFVRDLAHPSILNASHARRTLALNLLNQCLAQIQGYLGSGAEDTLTDARINLGEALKQIDAAGSALKKELEKEAADKHANDDGGGTRT